MTLAGQSVESGNRIYIMAKNQLVARAQTLTGEADFGADYVREIGNYEAVEIYYTALSGTVTLTRLRMVDKDLVDLGLVSLGTDILNLAVLDINVLDSITDSLLVSYRGCSANTLTDTFQMNQTNTQELQFMYLYSTKNQS